MPPPDVRAELAELFAKARADIDAVERRALALLDAPSRRAQPRWLSLGEAAAMMRCSPETAVKRIVRHGLGHKVDARWQVDRQKIEAWLAGGDSVIFEVQ